jgi:hypothetical protein
VLRKTAGKDDLQKAWSKHEIGYGEFRKRKGMGGK